MQLGAQSSMYYFLKVTDRLGRPLVITDSGGSYYMIVLRHIVIGEPMCTLIFSALVCTEKIAV
jgi:hypothetical protein